MDNNDGEIKFIQDVPLCVINVATVDNVYFATEFLEKIIQDNLWEKCEACNKLIIAIYIEIELNCRK